MSVCSSGSGEVPSEEEDPSPECSIFGNVDLSSTWDITT